MDKQIKTLLLSDSLYMIGFHLLDRKKLEMEKAQTDKQRLLGFDPKKIKDKQQSEPQTQGNGQAVKGPVAKSRQTGGSQAPFNKGSSFAMFENTYVSAETDSPNKVSK